MRSERVDKDPLQDSVWSRNLLRPALVVLVTISLMMGIVAVAQVIEPGWGRGVVLPYLTLVAVESTYTTLWLASPERRDRRTARFRWGELFLLLLTARLLSFVVQGRWPTASVLGEWLRHPLDVIDGTFFFLGLLTILAWGLSRAAIGTLEEMKLHPDELAGRPSALHGMEWHDVRARHAPRAQLLQTFMAYWLSGGVLLVLCAALSRVSWQPASGRLFGLSHLGLSPMLQFALVAYFVGGLILVSHGRLAILRVRWQYEGTEVDPAVVRRWGRIALGLLGLIALVAALLPVGSTFLLAQVLLVIMDIMMQVAYLFMLAMMWLFGGLLGLLMGPLEGEGIPMQRATPPPAPPQVSGRPLIPDWLGGALVWAILGLIVAYALAAYLAGRGGRLPWSWLRTLWGRIRAWWSRAAHQAGRTGRRWWTAIMARMPAQVSEPLSSWQFLHLTRLQPKERVRYFYLSTVKRAEDWGVRREPPETPVEFETDLEAHWPEVRAEIESLTEAFVDARYSAHEWDVDEMRRVQEIWARVKAALRARRE